MRTAITTLLGMTLILVKLAAAQQASRPAEPPSVKGVPVAPASRPAPEPLYRFAVWRCKDGSLIRAGGGSSCKTLSEWIEIAKQNCVGSDLQVYERCDWEGVRQPQR